MAVVAALIGGTWLLFMPSTPPSGTLLPGGGGETVDERLVWDSGLARLEADSVRIETPNGTFRAIDVTPIPDPDSGSAPGEWSPSPEEPWDERPGIEHVDFVVSSDSGSDRYRTLEVTWQERGVEMRMNIYFAADESHWWATEVRVYDGSEEGDWIGWGGAYSPSWVHERSWPSEDFEDRLRAFGVPPGVETGASAGDSEGLTSVSYRDRRGRIHVIACDERTAGVPEGPYTFKQAPAELCGPPPVDLGLFRSRRGEAWTGDLDLLDGVSDAGGDGRVSGELHIQAMRLSAFD